MLCPLSSIHLRARLLLLVQRSMVKSSSNLLKERSIGLVACMNNFVDMIWWREHALVPGSLHTVSLYYVLIISLANI